MTDSVLTRLSQTSLAQSATLTSTQSAVDNMVTHFVEEATSAQGLTAMAAGSLFYRVGRLGVLAAGAQTSRVAAPLFNLASYGVGLGAEVTAFEGTNRLLSSIGGNNTNPNAWRWSGRGGWAEGLTSSALTFGLLKSAGYAAREQNVILQHLVSDLAMVGGHQVTHAVGITPAPEGTFAEQLLHAEATNLQLGAGMSLLHTAAPGLHVLERSLDLSLRAHSALPSLRLFEGGSLASGPALAMAEGRSRFVPESEGQEIDRILRPQVMAMSKIEMGEPAPVSSGRGREGGGRTIRFWPASIPIEWQKAKGSNLLTSRSVETTRDLSEAIVNDGIKELLGEDAIHSIFGYGSFPFFRNGVPENIRLWDADKKPDFIIVGNNREMINNLADYWGLDDAQRAALIDHATYRPGGFREGFVFFNTDILVPGRGPISFKISLVDENAFFARRPRGPVLEYSQIRLKDATENNLLWSRDRKRSLSHLDAIRDQIFDEAYLRMGGGFLGALIHPSRFSRFSFKGEDLAAWFYRLSFRIEGYRFWENGRGSWDKGGKLFRERREESRELLLEEFRRFAVRNQSSLWINGERVDPARIDEQITSQNLYELNFEDRGISRAALGRSLRYWGMMPHFIGLNLRGLGSYIRHALPSNKLSNAYYRQPPAEYAGRKARNLVYKPGMTEVPPIARLLAHPIMRRLPIGNKIALDSIYYPVYYSSLPAFINDLYRSGRLNEAEYDALFRRISSSPALADYKNEGLLRELLNTEDSAGRNGAYKLLVHIKGLPFLEPSVDQYIRSVSIPSEEDLSREPFPPEIAQVMEHLVTMFNLLAAGESPRAYDYFGEMLRLSLPEGDPRLEELFAYIERSRRGENTRLHHEVSIRQKMLNPGVATEPIHPPFAIPIQQRARVVLAPGLLQPEQRTHLESAETLSSDSPPPASGERNRRGGSE
ncbi:MAG: hypothetical protein U1F57_12110 [bacterium]